MNLGMADNVTLHEHASDFQILLEKAEFTDQKGNSLNYENGINKNLKTLRSLRDGSGSLFLIGNGGSAAVVSHILTDFINVAGLKARTLHESSLITCMGNDYGYEHVFSQPLSVLAQKNDLLMAVSSSGNSLNIHNAVKRMKEIGGEIITLSGFESSNPLRAMGNLNIWIDSKNYGQVEIAHLFYLHYISEQLDLKRK